jgi:NHL repeat
MVYVADRLNGRIQIWFNDSVYSTKTISGNLSTPYSIFVTINGDIYVDNGNLTGRVDKWSLNTNISIVAMYVGQKCFSLFVDINDILYCSMRDLHQVVAKSLNSVSDVLTTIVAGVGCSGSTSNMLSSPYGIFVDINFDLYVADCGNNRIQLFPSDQLNGITVVGNGATETITLSCPTGVVLDADNYLFIVDSNNHRIVGSGPNGFRCLVGCYGSGLRSNTLLNPQSMAFDSYGNIFVTDSNNHRIQKFILFNNTLGKCEKIIN